MHSSFLLRKCHHTFGTYRFLSVNSKTSFYSIFELLMQPVTVLPGIGVVSASVLRDHGITSIGDLLNQVPVGIVDRRNELIGPVDKTYHDKIYTAEVVVKHKEYSELYGKSYKLQLQCQCSGADLAVLIEKLVFKILK